MLDNINGQISVRALITSTKDDIISSPVDPLTFAFSDDITITNVHDIHRESTDLDPSEALLIDFDTLLNPFNDTIGFSAVNYFVLYNDGTTDISLSTAPWNGIAAAATITVEAGDCMFISSATGWAVTAGDTFTITNLSGADIGSFQLILIGQSGS